MTEVAERMVTSPTTPAAPTPARPRRPRRGQVARYVVMGVFAAGFLMPLYLIVSASLKSSQLSGIDHMWALPTSIDMHGLQEAWNRLSPNVINSVVVTVPAVIVSSLLGSLNGFLLSKIKFRFSNGAFIFVLFGMYIPFQAVLVPLVRFLQSVSVYGTLLGLTLTHIIYGLTITTLIFRNYYAGIPDDIIEAASIDGAGTLSTYRRIILPLSAPGFVVAGIFQFTNIWNDFLFGLVVVPNSAQQPITVALNNLSGTTSVEWNVVMAGALLTALPTMALYLFVGRFFVRGLLAGSYR